MLNTIEKSAEELQKRIEELRRLLAQTRKGGDSKVEFDCCILLDCPHKRKFRQTLMDVIKVLEGTRKSFKSKQLEVLRKRLIGVLAEDA